MTTKCNYSLDPEDPKTYPSSYVSSENIWTNIEEDYFNCDRECLNEGDEYCAYHKEKENKKEIEKQILRDYKNQRKEKYKILKIVGGKNIFIDLDFFQKISYRFDKISLLGSSISKILDKENMELSKFENYYILSEIEINCCKLEYIHFQSFNFYRDLSIKNSEIIGQIYFDTTVFREDLSIRNTDFNKKLSLNNCKFFKNILMIDCNFNEKMFIYDSYLRRGINLKKSFFKKDVKLNECKGSRNCENTICLEEVVIDKGLKIKNCNFEGKTYNDLSVYNFKDLSCNNLSIRNCNITKTNNI